MTSQHNIFQAITDFFSNKQDVVAVYVFGSHAAGKARPTSDVDIAILFDTYRKEINRACCDGYLADLSRRLRKDIHLIVMNSAGEEIVRQILTKGKCLVVNDAEYLSRYKMVMLSRIIDFTFLQRQMQEGFTRNLLSEDNPST